MEKSKKDLRQTVLKLFKEKTKKECYEIKIIRKKGQDPSIFDDKVGGNPYLPKRVAYPIGKTSGNPLPLLFQLNLNHKKLPGYPTKGILEVFMDNYQDYSPTDYAIKYFKTIDEKNYQKEFPKFNIDANNPLYFEKGYKIKLIKTFDYMYPLDYRFNALLLSIVNKVYGLKLKELDDFEEDEVMEEYIHSNIKGIECTFGGYPEFTQGDPRESDSKRGDECLLKMQSIGDEYFGDLGIVSVLIDKKLIKSKQFEKGVLDWDCD